MQYNFKLIRAGDDADSQLIASMHRLRYRVFFEELKWTAGLKIVDNMEFDEYDLPGTIYLVHVNEMNEVDATCRVIPTIKPYMIAERYPKFIESIPIPNCDEIWEISRFCVSKETRMSDKKMTSKIIIAAIEFGLLNKVTNYVALATDWILPIIKRCGWDPQPIGALGETPDDKSYAIIYTVNKEMMNRIKDKNGLYH